MQDYIGKQIDRYRVTTRLGMGGMAAVYKAYDIRLDRDIALKLIRTRDIPESQHTYMMKRFEREAKAQARFSHPNIVPIYDYGEVDGFPYLVMEYLTGGALKDRITGPIEYQQALRWLIPIADALSYAHDRGVIHRDVKPGNILFDEINRPMLTDFGIAKALMTDQATLTATGLAIGTPEYMAPEQWQGKSCEATDQYALGVVLYELITGNRPFSADTPAAVVILQATEPLQPPRKFVRNIPESLEKLIYKTLSRDPEDRYESMTAFKQALSDLLIERDAPGSEQTIVYDQQTILQSIDDATELFDEDQILSDIQPQQPHEGTPSTAQVDTSQKAIPKKRLPAWVKWVGLAVLLLCLLGAGIGIVVSQSPALRDPGLLGMLGMRPAQTNTPTETQIDPTLLVETELSTPTQTATQTETPSPTVTSLPTHTKTPSPTMTSTPTPLLETKDIETMINSIDGAVMVYVPQGEFLMGSEDEDAFSDEQPEHLVYVDAFWIYQNPVTNIQYRQCIEVGRCYEQWEYISEDASNPLYLSSYDNHPVVRVSWHDAQSYCQWAGGRLPTEAEWEKTARGTDGRKYPWGYQTPTGGLLNNSGFYGNTSAVGSYPDGASPFGAKDMASNVWEWVADWYDPDYYSQSPYDNPTGPTHGEKRVIRGGSYRSHARLYRVTTRYSRISNYPMRGSFITSDIGFRCIIVP